MRKVFVLVFVLSMMSVHGGQAASTEQITPLARLAAADDQAAAWNKLSKEEQNQVINELTVTKIESSIQMDDQNILLGMGPDPRGCKGLTKTERGYSAAGLHIWTYEQHVSWCYDQSKRTILDVYDKQIRGLTHVPFWEYQGEKHSSESGGVGQGRYQWYNQGAFRFCIPFHGIGCTEIDNPWIDMLLYADGQFEGRSGY